MNENITNKHLVTASILSALGIIMGAFGAHALKELVSDTVLEIWKTAVTYQLFASAGTFVLCLLPLIKTNLNPRWPIFLLVTGNILFSGSLYIIVINKILQIGLLSTFMIPLTPIGGLLMTVSWMLLIVKLLKK